MSYKDLPLEERMQKATEYALILVSDDRPGLDIINELMDVFGFTEQEAIDCYTRMRKKFDDEFDEAIKTKIRFAWIALIFSTIILVFFAFLSTAVGWPSLIYTLIWGLILIGVVPFLAIHYREKAMSPESAFLFDRERYQKHKLDKEARDWTLGLPLMLLFLAVVAFYLFYSGTLILDTKDLYEKHNLVIYEKVDLNDTGGKSSHYEMIFRFKGFTNKFKFDENYYNYGKRKIKTSDFSVGDTLSIEMSGTNINRLQEGSKKDIKLTNIAINNDWLIDHQYRNKSVERGNKQSFILITAAFGVCLVVVFIWIRFRKVKGSYRYS